MRLVKDNVIIGVLFFFTNLCLILSVNYSLGSTITSIPRPYNLSANFVQLESSEPIKANYFNEILQSGKSSESLVFIVKTKDISNVGVYDPSMVLYQQSSKIVVPSIYRYFSDIDYSNGTSVGILVNSCDFIEVDKVKNSYKDYQVDEIINCMHVYNFDGTSVQFMQNLFSIDESAISTIFIDGRNVREIQNITEKLSEYGFEEVIAVNKNISILKSVSNSLFGSRYQQFMITSGIVMMLLFYYMLGLSFTKHKKNITVSQIVGATYPALLKKTLQGTFGISLFFGFLSYFMVIYLQLNKISFISLENYIKLELTLILTNCIICLTLSSLYYLRTKELKGGIL